MKNNAFRWMFVFLALATICSAPAAAQEQAADGQGDQTKIIRVLGDVSHAYAFGLCWQSGVARSYFPSPNERFTANHNTINEIDFEPYNLFMMPLHRSKDIPYELPQDADHVKNFMRKGGGVFLYCHVPGRDEPLENVGKFIDFFGYQHGPFAEGPLKLEEHELTEGVEVPTFGGRTLLLNKPEEWDVLVRDAKDRPVLAIREFSDGRLAVTGCDIVRGQKEGENAPHFSLLRKVFTWASDNKTVDMEGAVSEIGPENRMVLDNITVLYSDYLGDYALKAGDIYELIYPEMEKFMGVPMLAAKNIEPGRHTGNLTMTMLPCGDCGWSAGSRIGVAIYWGGFPENPTSVIGVMGHELHHSWLHGYGSNFTGHEALAIYAGSKMMQKLGYEEAWQAYLDKIDKMAANEKFMAQAPKENPTGKYQVVLKRMEDLYGEEIFAKYYQLRQKYVTGTGYRTTNDDAVWLWSVASGENQFPYFQSLGYEVSPDAVAIAAAREVELPEKLPEDSK